MTYFLLQYFRAQYLPKSNRILHHTRVFVSSKIIIYLLRNPLNKLIVEIANLIFSKNEVICHALTAHE